METMLLIAGNVFVALIVLRPVPRSHAIYVPIDVGEERGGLDCFPLIVAGIVVLVVLRLVGG